MPERIRPAALPQLHLLAAPAGNSVKQQSGVHDAVRAALEAARPRTVAHIGAWRRMRCGARSGRSTGAPVDRHACGEGDALVDSLALEDVAALPAAQSGSGGARRVRERHERGAPAPPRRQRPHAGGRCCVLTRSDQYRIGPKQRWGRSRNQRQQAAAPLCRGTHLVITSSPRRHRSTILAPSLVASTTAAMASAGGTREMSQHHSGVAHVVGVKVQARLSLNTGAV